MSSNKTRRRRYTHYQQDQKLPVCVQTGKFTYASRRAAEKVAKQAGKNAKVTLRPYQCADCVGWHITGKPRK